MREQKELGNVPELDPDSGIKSYQAREGPWDILKVTYILHMLSLMASLLLPVANSQHTENCMLLPVYMKNFSP